MIVLSTAQLGQITAAAEAAYPVECCGLLVGRVLDDEARWNVTRVVESDNLVEPVRPDRFEVDPALRLRLQRELRGGGEQVIGIYHSHPDGEAFPSATDLDAAWEPELIWVITAVPGGRVGETRAHKLAADGKSFEELSLAPAESAA